MVGICPESRGLRLAERGSTISNLDVAEKRQLDCWLSLIRTAHTHLDLARLSDILAQAHWPAQV